MKLQVAPMPDGSVVRRFYFHLRSGIRSVEDRIGEYQTDDVSAFARAVEIAKELRSKGSYSGFSIVVTGDDGHVVAQMPITVEKKIAA
jgi:hypothetical protein